MIFQRNSNGNVRLLAIFLQVIFLGWLSVEGLNHHTPRVFDNSRQYRVVASSSFYL